MAQYKITINIKAKRNMKKIIQYLLNAFIDILKNDYTIKEIKTDLVKIKECDKRNAQK